MANKYAVSNGSIAGHIWSDSNEGPAGTAATGSLSLDIATVPTQPSDGNTYAISDGTTTITFEFDDNASVTEGNTAVTIGGSVNATMAALVAAIDDAGFGVSVEAATPADHTCALLNGDPALGEDGNVAIVAVGAACQKTGMSGGSWVAAPGGGDTAVIDGRRVTISSGGPTITWTAVNVETAGSLVTINSGLELSCATVTGPTNRITGEGTLNMDGSATLDGDWTIGKWWMGTSGAQTLTSNGHSIIGNVEFRADGTMTQQDAANITGTLGLLSALATGVWAMGAFALTVSGEVSADADSTATITGTGVLTAPSYSIAATDPFAGFAGTLATGASLSLPVANMATGLNWRVNAGHTATLASAFVAGALYDAGAVVCTEFDLTATTTNFAGGSITRTSGTLDLGAVTVSESSSLPTAATITTLTTTAAKTAKLTGNLTPSGAITNNGIINLDSFVLTGTVSAGRVVCAGRATPNAIGSGIGQ